ncbi:MAG: 4Fe-4S binding protein [Selenomonadaceae bacterium]|jgi:NAD-dependent dihydropyrimidine dehydrogenase PreA subunit
MADLGQGKSAADGFCIHIDQQVCVRCLACVGDCPTGAIKLEGQVLVYRRDDCIACGSCLVICPVGALALEKIL